MSSIALVKVYIRNRADLELVRARLEPNLPPGAKCIYVEADICRPELMLEIEAIARAPRP